MAFFAASLRRCVAASLADFGHGSMTLGDGTKALGTRPLMALLVDWDSNPSKIASFHGLDYYERLAFGDPAPPFSTASPVNPASLSAYFRENSLGRFGYTRVGLFEVTMGSTVPDGCRPNAAVRCWRVPTEHARAAQRRPRHRARGERAEHRDGGELRRRPARQRLQRGLHPERTLRAFPSGRHPGADPAGGRRPALRPSSSWPTSCRTCCGRSTCTTWVSSPTTAT